MLHTSELQHCRRSGRQIPYAYLETVKNEFTAKYAEKSRTAQEGSLDKAFGCDFPSVTLRTASCECSQPDGVVSSFAT